MNLKHIQIYREIRSRIVNGTHTPGSRLPTRIELEDRYGVSSNTIQKALNRLIADGFVEARGREGTFVVQNPPHLSNIALLFPHEESETRKHQFWKSLLLDIETCQEISGTRVQPLFGFEYWRNIKIHRKLIDDVHEDRLAGLIFADNPHVLEGTPLLDDPGVARVSTMSSFVYPNIPIVTSDQKSFVNKALDYLLSCGRSRPAFLSWFVPDSFLNHFRSTARRRKMEVRTEWIQAVDPDSVHWVKNVLRLLMKMNGSDLPDSLIIGDSNMLELATRTLKAMGYKGKDDLTIVGRSSFPWIAKSHLPVRRLGVEANRFLGICVDLIRQQRNGITPPRETFLPALFEDELS